MYSFSGGRIKLANKRFSSLNNDYEVTFSERSIIEELRGADAAGGFKTRFTFVTLAQIESMGAETIVDVCGIVTQADDAKELTSKKGNALVKRDLTVVDCSGPSGSAMSVRLTLWGDNASLPDSTFIPGTIVAAKGMKVGEWGGRSLSANRGCTLLWNPDMQEAHKLKAWFDDGGSSAAVTSLTSGASGGGGAGRVTPFAERLNLAAIQERGLGNGEKPDYVTVKSVINFIKYDDERRIACVALRCGARLPCAARAAASLCAPRCSHMSSARYAPPAGAGAPAPTHRVDLLHTSAYSRTHHRHCTPSLTALTHHRYAACPEESSNKKCTETTDGQWHCEATDKTYDAPQWRYVMSVQVADAWGSQWVTLFNEQGTQLMNGKSAGELFDTKHMTGDAAWEAAFKAANFQEFIMTLRCKVETYNDEARLKVSVQRMAPIDYAAESRELINAITAMN